MKNNEGKTISEGDGPKMLWTIDYKKCNVCGECVDACKVSLLIFASAPIQPSRQINCNWCGDCADACASDAFVLT